MFNAAICRARHSSAFLTFAFFAFNADESFWKYDELIRISPLAMASDRPPKQHKG